VGIERRPGAEEGGGNKTAASGGVKTCNEMRWDGPPVCVYVYVCVCVLIF